MTPRNLYLHYGGLGIYDLTQIRQHVIKRGPRAGKALALRFGSYVPSPAAGWPPGDAQSDGPGPERAAGLDTNRFRGVRGDSANRGYRVVMPSSVLMSLRPPYADAILAGRKTVELRRRRPSFSPGTTVLIYSSSPDQHVLGTFEAGEVTARAPDQLWPLVRGRAGVTRREFDAYFTGCEMAYAIEVRRPQRVEPAPLGIRPPQSYLFLRGADRRHRKLLTLLAAASA